MEENMQPQASPPAPPSSTNTYPATFSVDYPEGKRNRLTGFFRLFMVIPIVIVLALLGGISSSSYSGNHWHWSSTAGFVRDGATTGSSWTIGGAGFLFFAILLMVLFRKKYPKWWFDWSLAYARFSTRISAYLFLLRDEYPSTDEEQAVHLDVVYPNASTDLNRWLPLVKWFLAIPHYIVLLFLFIGAFFATIFAWFAVVFAASYPKSLFDFVVGTYRWSLRVYAYAFLLTTDRYPPFSLE